MTSTIDELLLKSETKDIFIRNLMSSLILTTKSANELPHKTNPNSLNYFHTFNEFSHKNENCLEKIKSLIKSIVDFVKGIICYYYNLIIILVDSEAHTGQIDLPVIVTIIIFNLRYMNNYFIFIIIKDDLRDPNFYNVISDIIDSLLENADTNLSSLNNNENKSVIQQFNNSITQSLALVIIIILLVDI